MSKWQSQRYQGTCHSNLERACAKEYASKDTCYVCKEIGHHGNAWVDELSESEKGKVKGPDLNDDIDYRPSKRCQHVPFI